MSNLKIPLPKLASCPPFHSYDNKLLLEEEENASAVRQEAPEAFSRIVWTLAWPAVALNSLQVVNNLLDSFFIGHLEGAAMTAQSGAMSLMFLMFSLAMALGTASTALVSRAYGADKPEEFRAACRKCLSLALVSGLFLTVVCMLLARPAASLLLPADNPRALALMARFLAIYACSLPAIFLIQTLAGALRGIGDTRSPMVISGFQILLHIGLNYLLIFPPRELAGGIHMPGFDMGLMGAATALSISAWVSAIAYLAYCGRTPLGEAWRFDIPEAAWIKRILKIALPAAGMAVLRVASLAVFTIALKMTPNGSDAIGGMRPGFAIESIMFMPAFGLSMAAAALVGQSLGMKRPDRAERLAWTAAHHAALVTSLCVIPIFFGAHAIADAMILNKPEMASEAAMLIRWLCVTEVFFAYAMVMIGAMQGAGDTVRPLWITIIALWVLRVPMTFLFAIALRWGPAGAWFAMSFSQAVQGVLAIWAFRKGTWKLKTV